MLNYDINGKLNGDYISYDNYGIAINKAYYTDGKIDGFVCAVGTGGTLAGVSIGLKKKNKNIKIALSDPMGSSLYSYIKNNKLENTGSSITEGIGTARITKNFDRALVDDAFQADDIEALKIVYDLIDDPNELNNLVESRPDMVKKLKSKMENWLAFRKQKTGMDTPIFDQGDWHGFQGVGSFKTSEQAYESLYLGDAGMAKRLQEKSR